MKIEFTSDEKGKIILPEGPPYDEEPVLIHLAKGWCEAVWIPADLSHAATETDDTGFYWSCLDDDFQADFDEPDQWFPLPHLETDQ